MRQAYAHEAVLILPLAGDDRAPGGAITAALCGKLIRIDGEELRLRILFATPPDRAEEVRARIDAALENGSFTGPDGTTTRWRTVRSGCIELATEDRPHARRLLK